MWLVIRHQMRRLNVGISLVKSCWFLYVTFNFTCIHLSFLGVMFISVKSFTVLTLTSWFLIYCSKLANAWSTFAELEEDTDLIMYNSMHSWQIWLFKNFSQSYSNMASQQANWAAVGLIYSRMNLDVFLEW